MVCLAYRPFPEVTYGSAGELDRVFVSNDGYIDSTASLIFSLF